MINISKSFLSEDPEFTMVEYSCIGIYFEGLCLLFPQDSQRLEKFIQDLKDKYDDLLRKRLLASAEQQKESVEEVTNAAELPCSDDEQSNETMEPIILDSNDLDYTVYVSDDQRNTETSAFESDIPF